MEHTLEPWDEMYGQETPPTDKQIQHYIGSALWDKLNDWLQKTYGAAPKYFFSRCSMQRGWNIKYHKGGRALCTLYPMDGYFLALVVVGERERPEVELMLDGMSEYTRRLYEQTPTGHGGRWLMLEVRDEEVLRDVQTLVFARKAPRARPA